MQAPLGAAIEMDVTRPREGTSDPLAMAICRIPALAIYVAGRFCAESSPNFAPNMNLS